MAYYGNHRDYSLSPLRDLAYNQAAKADAYADSAANARVDGQAGHSGGVGFGGAAGYGFAVKPDHELVGAPPQLVVGLAHAHFPALGREHRGAREAGDPGRWVVGWLGFCGWVVVVLTMVVWSYEPAADHDDVHLAWHLFACRH